jgi:hypothetical protein
VKPIFFILFILLTANIASAEESYTNEAIAEAIFWTEGGYKTNYPYGIKSVYCQGIEECKKVCLNTIQNNRIRFSEYGYKQYKDYLSFLASRYCPASDEGCENWLPNVRRLLSKNRNM